jgi:hypothetical protein
MFSNLPEHVLLMIVDSLIWEDNTPNMADIGTCEKG